MNNTKQTDSVWLPGENVKSDHVHKFTLFDNSVRVWLPKGQQSFTVAAFTWTLFVLIGMKSSFIKQMNPSVYMNAK